MTDADVDGSHIRTLLLTFFFRQMREVIEQGYLYIAQPPLFGVQKGKKNTIYLKDQRALDEYLVNNAVEDLVFESKANRTRKLLGDPLRILAQDLKRFKVALGNLDKRCDARVVASLIRAAGVAQEDLRDEAKVDSAREKLKAYLERRYPDMMPFKVESTFDTEHGAFRITVTPRPGASSRVSVIDWQLLGLPEYKDALGIERSIVDLLGPAPWVAISKGDEVDLESTEALIEYLDLRGRKGISIKRYKGLGEMNAEELWETTMNPDARAMLQVRIDDEAEASRLFAILMGEQVDERKRFIEVNALNVKNLDI
jgi:DNA gyrase subunit B